MDGVVASRESAASSTAFNTFASQKGRLDVTTNSGKRMGLTTGGVIVIAGIVIAVIWSLWIGVIVALIGLIAFGGFVRGRWY
ncbi:MAG: hypothetical protein ABI927_08010 [Gaiellaceae bacterium]